MTSIIGFSSKHTLVFFSRHIHVYVGLEWTSLGVVDDVWDCTM